MQRRGRYGGVPLKANPTSPMTEHQQAGRPADKPGIATSANSEERFRLLLESIKDYSILMLDPGGLVTTWNKARSVSRDTVPTRSSAGIFRTSTRRRMLLKESQNTSLLSLPPKADAKTKGGAYARTGRSFGQRWSSPRFTTTTES